MERWGYSRSQDDFVALANAFSADAPPVPSYNSVRIVTRIDTGML